MNQPCNESTLWQIDPGMNWSTMNRPAMNRSKMNRPCGKFNLSCDESIHDESNLRWIDPRWIDSPMNQTCDESTLWQIDPALNRSTMNRPAMNRLSDESTLQWIDLAMNQTCDESTLWQIDPTMNRPCNESTESNEKFCNVGGNHSTL
jgi:hypothetical protein